MPSRLKSPMATERGFVPALKSTGAAKVTGLQVKAGVVTVSMKVFVVVTPEPLKAVTVTT